MSEIIEKPQPCPECGKPLTSIGVSRGNMIEWMEEEQEETFEDEDEADQCVAEHEGAQKEQTEDNLDRALWRVTWTEGHFEDNGQGNITYTCGECGKEIGGYNANDSWGIGVEVE